MRINKPLLLAVIVLVIAVALLFSGYEILTEKILFIHIGTLIAWIALTAFAYSSYLIVQSNPKMKIVQRVVLLLALLWFVVSSLIAGNTDLTFHSSRLSKIWVLYTAFIVFCSLFAVIFQIIRRLKQKYFSS